MISAFLSVCYRGRYVNDIFAVCFYYIFKSVLGLCGMVVLPPGGLTPVLRPVL
jgi:hypothetical protein